LAEVLRAVFNCFLAIVCLAAGFVDDDEEDDDDDELEEEEEEEEEDEDDEAVSDVST
jgi:Ran GTPase-activating protein (RanGAP) involved in mRNA processing and transport